MRAVVDTNVVVSALHHPAGTPSAAVKAGLRGAFVWITSTELLTELTRVLARPRVRALLPHDDEVLARFAGDIRELAIIVEPAHRLDVSCDADDNRVLEAAVAGNADYIVTGDRDLLELGSRESIRIVTPAAFVKLLPR